MEELARFRQFLNEMDYIDGINENEAYFDNLLKEFDGVKKALIDVARVSLAKASYGYNFDASQVGGFAKDEKWKKYLRADFKDVKSNLSSYINKNYLEDKYWKGDPNTLFVYIKEDIDQIIDSLERWLIVSEREIDGQDLKDEKVKEKYKVVLLEIETIKKAISILEKFKSTLAEDPRSIQENKEKMKEFNLSKWRQFVIAESDFGNDPEDRYKYARKFTADLPDTARSEYLVSALDDALEDYRLTDEVGEFDQAFVDVMKALGKEKELSEDLFSPNEMSAMAIEKEMAEGIPDVNTDFSVDTDFSDDLSENDAVLDEIVKDAKFEVGDKVTMKAGGDEMEITKARKMFGSDTQAYTVKKSDGKTDEYSANQLKKA